MRARGLGSAPAPARGGGAEGQCRGHRRRSALPPPANEKDGREGAGAPHPGQKGGRTSRSSEGGRPRPGSRPAAKSTRTAPQTQPGNALATPAQPQAHSPPRAPAARTHRHRLLVVVTEAVRRLLVLAVHPALLAATEGGDSAPGRTVNARPAAEMMPALCQVRLVLPTPPSRPVRKPRPRPAV